MSEGVKKGILLAVKELSADETFAIEILNVLLDNVWTREDIIEAIDEELNDEVSEEQMREWEKSVAYQHREYERSV